MCLHPRVLRCVIHEDDHLLVVNKPAGWNTHAPSPFANEGLYDWLRHREPRWATLAIIHRLDKETSGVMVFAKTPLANKSLTAQFTRHEVRKRYLLLTDRKTPAQARTVKSNLIRLSERYASSKARTLAETAETHFRPLTKAELEVLPLPRQWFPLIAEPLTGRTHQIRVHASEQGFPILGDALYGGSSAARVFLHASEISLQHPDSGERVTFRSEPDFAEARERRLMTAEDTNACRLIHGASDAWPGWYVDRLGDYLLSQSEQALDAKHLQALEGLQTDHQAKGCYHKELRKSVRGSSPRETSPRLVLGAAAPDRFLIRESGLTFEMSFAEGYSAGLFLDQRDNRRRLLTRYVAPGFELQPGYRLLNCFAYTCGFSVAAAAGGAITTSLDLSKKYLEWGRQNFRVNQLDPATHDFIFGDVFDWMKRLARKGRQFDVIVLDPPTFSQSKESGVFRAQRDYGRLVNSALSLLVPDGVLFCSTNAAGWAPEEFLTEVRHAASAAGRPPKQEQYIPQPPDFPISRIEAGYLKTAWLRL